MKPYFAKYLPVEGEIKEGDWYKSPSGSILSQHNGTELLPDGWYKVKLFLCSRDLNYGDEVTCINPYSVNYLKKSKHFEFGDTESWAKVIGEISPEAKWVKEGDEFDEDNIYFQDCGKHVECCDGDCKFPNWKGGEFIQIKCPTCEKFY